MLLGLICHHTFWTIPDGITAPWEKGIHVGYVMCASKLGPEILHFFMLSSSGHEVYNAHKFLNANNCWHLNSH